MNKKDANRQNAAKSTGPKTEAGKRQTKFNALAHGFYSTELIIPEGNEAEFENLRTSIYRELAPATALQRVACENIVCCCWRCKLAMRAEMLHLKSHFGIPNGRDEQSEAPAENMAMTQWYGSNRETIRQGRRFLAKLREDIEQNGWIHAEEWKDSIIKGFGVEFYELLNKWAPMNLDAVRLAEFLHARSETFKTPLPASIEMAIGRNTETASTNAETAADEKAKIADPALLHQMLVKLTSLEDQHLEALARSYEQRSAAGPGSHDSVDFSPRYFTTASRDLHRAVDWFQYLKGNNV
jgi:hypothetical protein